MTRRKQPPNAARMYRHFAVVTVALTAVLAVFADGENRQALADEMQARQQKAELARASREKFGPPRLINHTRFSAGGSFGSDNGEFGAPMDNVGSSDSSYIPSEATFVPADYARFGLSEDEWAALSEDQREALRREGRESAALAGSSERAQQIDRLMAASAARSGGSAYY